MDIGCHLPNQGPLANGESLARFAREAEQRGVASLWVSDHVIFPRSATGSYPGGRFPHPPDKPYLEPVTVLAAAAMCTSRARLGAQRQEGRHGSFRRSLAAAGRGHASRVALLQPVRAVRLRGRRPAGVVRVAPGRSCAGLRACYAVAHYRYRKGERV